MKLKTELMPYKEKTISYTHNLISLQNFYHEFNNKNVLNKPLTDGCIGSMRQE